MRKSLPLCLAALTLIAITPPRERAPFILVPPTEAPTYEAVDGDPVSLGTGLYVRNTIDLVLVDQIPVVFSRTYRNRDTISRPFGIGTNHSFGSFLIGDAPEITYAELILPDGGRVHYNRISAGSGHIGAVFEHTSSPSEYLGSRLFWNGAGWTIQLRDGSRYTYPECPPSLNKACSMSSYRDKDGHELRMRHDQNMNLVRIETPGRAAIDLTYDDHDRIVLARSNYDQQVRYQYDPQGRLVRVIGVDGREMRYAYDDRHQMVQIEEPGVSITNTFDNGGRTILNDVRTEEVDRQGKAVMDRLLFKFAYILAPDGRIIATEVDGPRGLRKVTFNERGYRVTDVLVAKRAGEAGTEYTREGASNVVQRLKVWCGSDRRRVQVEAVLNADLPAETIREQLQSTCASVMQRP